MPRNTFDKYALYMDAVQSPETDVPFFRRVYKELRGRKPQTLREDFCGTYILCQEWVRTDKNAIAYGIDLDPEPLEYGHGLKETKLTKDQKARVHALKMDVRASDSPSADMIVALNFSHFIFKTRAEMREYFTAVYKKMNDKGVFLIDCFGGSQCYAAIEEETKHDKFSYFWDQDGYDPISGEAMFHIHFKPKGRAKVKNVFNYDWRLWSIPELREILEEAGFKKTSVYWEGTTKKGEGDGNFQRTKVGEDCESWIAYIAAER